MKKNPDLTSEIIKFYRSQTAKKRSTILSSPSKRISVNKPLSPTAPTAHEQNPE